MLTRRTFIQSAGVLGAGVATGAIGRTKPEIREHGIVEIRFMFLAKEPVVVKSTIFSDEQRGVFGVRLLGERGARDMRLAEIPLSAVKDAVAVPGRISRCAMTGWAGEGAKDSGLLDLVAKDGNLVVSGRGHLNDEPVWMSLDDVRQVL